MQIIEIIFQNNAEKEKVKTRLASMNRHFMEYEGILHIPVTEREANLICDHVERFMTTMGIQVKA